MTTQNETLKLALEALKLSLPAQCGQSDDMYEQEWREHFAAIRAVREALAQPEQELAPTKCVAIIEVLGRDWLLEYMSLPVGRHKLYARQYTYVAPPKRKPLSEEEIEQCCFDADSQADDHPQTWKWTVAFARAIEAAHGISGEAA